MTHDVAEDVDIYSDLSSVNYTDCIKQLETANRNLIEQVNNLKIELSGTSQEKEKLEARCRILSNNISCLFKTAKAEIVRKDRTISELHTKINDVLFRRNQMGGSWSSRQRGRESASTSTSNSQSQKNNTSSDRSDRNEKRIPVNHNKGNDRLSRVDKTSCRAEENVKLNENNRNKCKLGKESLDKEKKKCHTESKGEESTCKTNSHYSKQRDISDRAGKEHNFETSKEKSRTQLKSKSQSSKVVSEGSWHKINNESGNENETMCNIVNSSFDKQCDNNQFCNNSLNVNSENPLQSSEEVDSNLIPDKEVYSSDNSKGDQISKNDMSLIMQNEASFMTEYSRRMLLRGLVKPDLKNRTNKLIASVKNINSDQILHHLPSQDSVPIKLLNNDDDNHPTNRDFQTNKLDNPESDSLKKLYSPKSIFSEKFAPICETVSMDLSISSSSNSELGDLDHSKSHGQVASFCSSKEKVVQKHDKCPISDLNSPKTPMNQIIPNNSANLVEVVSVSKVVEAERIDDKKNIMSVPDAIKVAATSNGLSPQLDLCSNSLQEILNLNNDKNKIANVSFELFSLDSIDKLADSPKKVSIDVPSKELETKVLSGSVNPLTPASKSKSASKLSSINEGNRQFNKDIEVEKSKTDTVKNSLEIYKNVCMEGCSVSSNSEFKCMTGVINDAVKTNCDENIILKKSSLELDASSAQQEGFVEVNCESFQRISSTSVQMKNTSKNGSKPVINPISSLWSKTFLKCDDISYNQTKTIAKETTVIDKQKVSMVQSLFGSPVKWADSDSIDFLPPSIEKDPSIFEDSRSVSDCVQVNFKTPSEVIIEKDDALDEKCNDGSAELKKASAETEKTDSTINENKLRSKDDKASLSSKFPCSGFEDTTLGQFEDTLQFVSALSVLKETVSPISTPEKILDANLSINSSQPFSALNIHQKTGFKIVSPSEKPINILTPRRTPRIVSPQKLNTSGSSPNSSDPKSCRISCIDDKAIKSVCNLVSSIKDTHRETYLVISKKPKANRNHSPKKIDINDSNISKNISPSNSKASPIKSPNKNNLNQKTNDKIDSVKKFPQLKLSSKKNTKKIPTSKQTSCQSINKSDVPATDSSISTPAKVSSTSLQQKKLRRIQLIESLPLIPKASNCTKVRMSYELKKPSRMNKRQTNGREKNIPRNVSTSASNIINKYKGKIEDDNNTDRMVEEKCHEGLPKMSDVSTQEILNENVESKTCVRNKIENDSVKSIGSDPCQGRVEVADKAAICNASQELQCSKITEPRKSNDSQKLSVESEQVENITALSKQNISVESNKIFVKTKSEINCSKNSSINTILDDSDYGNINFTCDSKYLQNNKLLSREVKINKHGDLLFQQKLSSKDKNSDTSESESINKLSFCSLKAEEKTLPKQLSVSSRTSSAGSNSIKPPSSPRKPRKSYISFDEANKCRRAEESLHNLKLNRRHHSRSPEHSRDGDRDKYRSRAKDQYHCLPPDDHHYYKRFYREKNHLPYREHLSSRYSFYRRREPSICKYSRSTRKDNKKYPYKTESSKDRVHVHSSRERPSSPVSKQEDKALRGKESITKTVKRDWGSSSVMAVTLSKRCPSDTESLNKTPYDRINGIVCNNIMWKLIKIDGVQDRPREKEQLSSPETPLCSATSSCRTTPVKMVSRKRSNNFSSSDTKTEFFSSSPKKSEPHVGQFSKVTIVETSVDEISSDFKKSNRSSSKVSTSPHKYLSSSNSNNISKRLKFEEKPKELDSPLKKVCVPKNCTPDNNKSSEKSSSFHHGENTITYRMPTFMKKTNDPEVKTVKVANMTNKYTFSPPRGIDSNVNKQYSDESRLSDSSFTSDESWAPKKKRKR